MGGLHELCQRWDGVFDLYVGAIVKVFSPKSTTGNRVCTIDIVKFAWEVPAQSGTLPPRRLFPRTSDVAGDPAPRRSAGSRCVLRQRLDDLAKAGRVVL